MQQPQHPTAGTTAKQSASQPKARATPAATAAAAASVTPTTQQSSIYAAMSYDERMKIFLQRLQKRNDAYPLADAGPTVPTALSRRMLHTQGVGYLDETVAAITSAAADRFLATVLQQAVACRDQRLKGADSAKEEGRQRRKHYSLYQQDADDRKRRKLARKEAKFKANLAAIKASSDLTQGISNSSGTGTSSSSKKSKKKLDDNGESSAATHPKAVKFDEHDGESSDDSIDEEEWYYREYFGGTGPVREDARRREGGGSGSDSANNNNNNNASNNGNGSNDANHSKAGTDTGVGNSAGGSGTGGGNNNGNADNSNNNATSTGDNGAGPALDNGDDDDEDEEEEDEETRYMLLLRDLEAPLKAWDMNLTGKIGLGVIPLEAREDQKEETQPNLAAAPTTDDAALEELENGTDGPPSPVKPRATPTKAVENGPRSRTATPVAGSGGGSGPAAAEQRAQTPANGPN